MTDHLPDLTIVFYFVKLVLCANASLVSKLMQSYMGFPHVIRTQIIRICILKFLIYNIVVGFVWYFSSNHRYPHWNTKTYKRINKQIPPSILDVK